MANPEHLAKLKEGVEAWNKWREENPDIKPDFIKVDLKKAALIKANLQGAILRGASLQGAILRGANLQGADLSEADLQGAVLTRSNLRGVDFSRANLCGSKLVEADIQRADLCEAKLQGADLGKANLQEIDLSGANLQGIELSGANLQKANLREAKLQGVKLWQADLQGANLSMANLRGSDLGFAKLQKASLNRANLQGADLSFATLQKASLNRANLQGADLRMSDLEKAYVSGVKYDKKMKCRKIQVAACLGSLMFKRFAQDQDYLEELQEKRRDFTIFGKSLSIRWGKIIYHLWNIFSDCGRSFHRIALWALAFALFFGAVFMGMGPEHFHIGALDDELSTYIYYGIVNLVSLGSEEFYPLTPTGAFWDAFEIIIGYIILGGLISVLGEKLARRS